MFNLPLVTGFTHEFDPEVRIDGGSTSVTKPSLVASTVRYTPESGSTFDDGVRLASLSGSARFFGVASLSLDRFRDATFVYSLPSGVSADEVDSAELHLGRQGPGRLELEVYDPRTEEWSPLGSVRFGSLKEPFDPGVFSSAGEAYFRATSQGPPFSELYELGVEVGLR